LVILLLPLFTTTMPSVTSAYTHTSVFSVIPKLRYTRSANWLRITMDTLLYLWQGSIITLDLPTDQGRYKINFIWRRYWDFASGFILLRFFHHMSYSYWFFFCFFLRFFRLDFRTDFDRTLFSIYAIRTKEKNVKE
jgi:hypothetical protein